MNSIGDRDSIIRQLSMLADELAEAKITAGIRIVGGAAISLEYGDRGVTFDIDIVDNDEELHSAARRVAERHGWDPNWLNSAALAYYPPMADDEWIQVAQLRSLTVSVATAQTLLAMKLNAGRGARDDDDIALLLAICNITTVAGAEELFETNYPREAIPERSMIALRDLLRD